MIDLLPRLGRRTAKLVIRSGGLPTFKALEDITGVAYNNKSSVAFFPRETRMLELMLKAAPLPLSESVQLWYDFEIGMEKESAALLLQEDVELAHEKASILRKYQRIGVDFMVHGCRTLMCDEMGLGKTAQTIVAVETTRFHRSMMVVCPNSVKYQWQEEILKWTQCDQPITVIEWKNRVEQLESYAGGWLILNYHNFRSDTAFQSMGYWDWVIFDEAHKLKNRKSQTFSAAKAMKSKRMALLTGTPTGNDVSEVWALLHLLNPMRYTSFWRFFEMYVGYYQDYFGARKIFGVRNPELLRRELSTRMVQRKKKDVLPELPAKIHQTVPVQMTKTQKRTYDRMAKEAAILMTSGELLTAVNQMAVLMRLRQILSTTANFDLPDHSGKLDAAVELIQNAGKKVIVFTVFRKTVMAVLRRLDVAGIKSVRIMGGVSAEDRQLAKQAINTSDTQVLVCTIKSGGLGLNLQGASVGIFVEKEWNPIDQAQAEDRMHRIGQTETVHIISLICQGTVDESVERLLAKKQRMTDEILKETLFAELRKYT
ncbi:hypothetical protein LCGC14_0275110 [marine sediment metagenome]|uniref:Uncharacterized protein n=1 Tax=marine sediment metagenome TaxID=412755 RepID=A0A0F9WIC5_9ZZZZ